ncbi:MAG: ribosome silencing factor [Planctomycetes bacterium]|nr:ribosome silencing factor [Planctomycetota bacterium]
MSKSLPESVPASPPISRPARKPSPATTQAALAIAQQLSNLQATDIVILDMSGPLVIADYFVIATVTSTRQAQALARELDVASKASTGRKRRNTGGMESEDSNWVLLDFDDVVVHLFLPEARAYYGLETLWADVPRLPFTPAARPPEAPQQPDLGGIQFRVFPTPDEPDDR